MSARRRGFSLIELLCVMFLLTVLLTMLAVLLREIMRVERIQSAGFERILESKVLADQFRTDVASATKDVKEWNNFNADAATLILEMKNEDHIVYRWDNGKLTRHAFLANEAEHKKTLPIGGRHIDVEFIHADKQSIIRLRLHPLSDEKRDAGKSLEFAASLGGDWR